MSLIRRLLLSPLAMLFSIMAISAFALGAALFSEVALGLEPCPLCIYQRIPFFVAMLLGLIGLFMRRNPIAVNGLLALLGITFLVNSAIAFYHTGVEQKWWESGVEGCSVPNFAAMQEQGPQSILENIMSAPTGNCAEIPWQDPLFGLSMANLNVLLCLGIFAACFASLIVRSKAEAQ